MTSYTGRVGAVGSREYGGRVRVRLTTLHSSGVAVEGVALIDTGASHTAIDLQAAQDCGLTFLESRQARTTSGVSIMPIYEGRLEITDIPGYQEEGPFPTAPLRDGGIIALIGVDTLANGTLVFDGRAGEFTLSLRDS